MADEQQPEKLTLSDIIQGIRAISNHPDAAPLHAFVRQGAHELTQILPAFPDSNVRPIEEPGAMGNPTQMIVTNEITGKLSLDDLRAYAKDRAQEAEQQMERQHERQRDSGGMEM